MRKTSAVLLLLAACFLTHDASAGAIKYRNSPGDMSWINGRVPYTFNTDVSEDKRKIFDGAARAWQRVANLNFVRTTEYGFHQSADGDYILVQTNSLGEGWNYSWIGRSGPSGYPFTGMQPLSINVWEQGLITHEVGHALGFIHEQQRTDRDDWVQLDWGQINGFTAVNWEIERNTVNRTDYDYFSIMHYWSTTYQDDWKTGHCMVATHGCTHHGEVLSAEDVTARMGTKIPNANYPDDLHSTNLLSDGDREAIIEEYGSSSRVSGSVIAANGKPLEGATVTLEGLGEAANVIRLMKTAKEDRVRSGPDGAFTFIGLPNGQYKVKISKTGFTFSPSEFAFTAVSAGVDVMYYQPLFEGTNISDTVPPTVGFTKPDPEPKHHYQNLTAVSGTVVDTGGAEIRDVRIAISDSAGQWLNFSSGDFDPLGTTFVFDNHGPTATISGETWSREIPPLVEGSYTAYVLAGDYTSNISEWESTSFVIDRTKPVITSTLPGPADSFFDFEKLGGVATDAGAPDLKVVFAIVEKNATNPRYWTGSQWTTDSKDPKTVLTATVSDGKWVPQSRLPTRAELREGPFLVDVSAFDAAGNSQLAVSLNLTRSPLDTTVPEIAIEEPVHEVVYGERAMPVISGTASDDGSPIQGVRVYLMRQLPGGVYKYWSLDTNVDQTLEPLTRYKWSDTVAHVEADYDEENGTWTAPREGFRLPAGDELPDGTYRVQAMAFNRESPQGTRSVEHIFRIALEPPTVTVTSPSQNGFVKAGWDISGTVTDPSGTGFLNDRVTITLNYNGNYWNGDSWVEGQVELYATIAEDGTWTFPAESLPSEEGEFAVSVSVRDNNGISSMPTSGGNQLIFRVDRTPPEVVISAPGENEVITVLPSAGAWFFGTASDAYPTQPGVSLYLMRAGVNGGADTYWTGSGWTQNIGEGELMAEYLTSGGPEWEPPLALPRLGQDSWHCLSDGAYTFMAVARDAAGNETQRQVAITIDTSITFPDQTPSEPQDIPLTPDAVTATERLTFAPVPGDERNQHVSFIGRDLSGNVYSGMSLSFPSSSDSSSAVVKHGVAAANPGGLTELWRKERQKQITNYTSGDTTIYQYWERWSDAEAWQEISVENFSNPHLSIGDLVVDGAGNVFAAFNVLANGSYAIVNYPYWRDGLLRSNTTYIVKWDTNGVVQGRWTLRGSQSSSNVIEMELLNDGSVAVLIDNYYDGRHSVYSNPYRHNTIVARVGSASGDFFSATALTGHSQAGALEIDAADNIYVLSGEAEGDSYFASEHVLEKLSPEGDLLRRVKVCYCDAPEAWTQMKVDKASAEIYVAGSLMVEGEDGGRMVVTKFNLQNVENSEQVWRVYSPPRTTGSWGGVVLNLHQEGLTVGSTGYDSMSSYSDYYVSIARFTKEGEFEWCRTNADSSIAYTSPYSGDGVSLTDFTTDAEGNVYIVGSGIRHGLIKLAANGDLQFIKPFPEGNYFAQYGGHHESRLWLSPEGSIETLVHKNSYSEFAILSFSNPAIVLIPVAIPAGGEPLDQSVETGTQVLFSVSNTGSAAHYQWYKEDANGNPQPIDGANTSSLLIPQVQAADAGRYSVVLTGKEDPSDSVTSRTATLTVYEVVPMADALDFAGLTWINGGLGEWFGHTGVSHDGVDAATVVLGVYEGAWMETTLSGPGTLSFWWQKPYGYSENLRLLLDPNETSDGTVLAIAEPNGGWSQQMVTIPEGTHTVRFQFDSAYTPGVRALVDEINYVRGSQPAAVTVDSPGADSTVFALPSVSGSAADVIETVTFSMQRAEDGKFWDGMSWIGEMVELSTDYNRVAGTWTSDELLPAPGSDSATTLLDGVYYFTAYGRNSVGDFVNHTVYVEIYVNAALGISLTTPQDGDTLSELTYLRGETTARTERVEVTIERLSDGMFWNRMDWQVPAQALPANYFRDGGVWSYTELPEFEEGSYRLTATAYDAEENSAQVVATVEIGGASLPVLTALTIDPATADVTSAGTTLSVTLQATGPAPISFGVVTLTSPSGANTVDAYFSSWDMVADAFQIQLNLSRYLEPGTWTVSVYLQDENNVSASYGSNSSPLPAGATAEVQIANTGPVDQTPPELVSLQMAPSSVDVTGSGADVTVTAHLRDDVGVQSGSFALQSPGGKTIYAYFSAANRISGTVADGIYQTVLQIPAHAEPGTWIPSLDISDMAGNSQYGVSLPEGSTTGLLVVNSGPVDSVPPVLESLTIQPTSVDVTNGAQTVTVTLQATDDVAGLTAGSFSLISPDGWHHAYQNFDQAALTSGTPQAGTYQFTVTVPRFVVPGVWKAELQLRDASGNSVNFGTNSWQAQFPAGAVSEIAVLNSGQIDYNPPAVSSIAFTPSTVAAGSSSAQVSLTFELTDSLSGVAGGYVGFWKDYIEITADFDTASRVSGDASAGTYQVQLEIPAGTDPGNWELGIVVRDAAGNWSYRGAASYDPAPLPNGTLTTLTVSAESVNNLPLVQAGEDFTAFAGAALPFAGTFTDDDAGQTHTIEWDFGDGTTASGSLTPSHTFATPGSYAVTLTVTDSEGASASDTLTVTVQEHMTYEEWAEEAFAPGTPVSEMDDAADPDGDRIPNWAEWAFNTGPQNSGESATTIPRTIKDQATGETCLIMSFNRRIGGAGISYVVEVSDTLGGWDGTGTQVESVGTPVPNADGVTERVTVCVRSPAAVTEKFMRVSVQR